MCFLDRFKFLCDKEGVKPTPLIKSLGFSAGNIKRWENGATINSDILIKIANYFNVSIDYLLCQTDNPSKNTISIDSSNIVNGNNGNNSPLTINNKEESISQDDTEILKLIKKLPLKKRIDFISMLYNELGEE